MQKMSEVETKPTTTDALTTEGEISGLKISLATGREMAHDRMGHSVVSAPECKIQDRNMTNPVCMMTTPGHAVSGDLTMKYDRLNP